MTAAEIAPIYQSIIVTFYEAISEYDEKEFADMNAGAQDKVITACQHFIDKPTASVGSIHRAWRRQRVADGWRPGHPFDLQNKIDPDVVQFEGLGREKRIRYYLLKRVVELLKDV